MDETLLQEIWRRAGSACEYCRMSEEHYPARFEVDHIIARQHDGPTSPGNLALSCLHCNLHKGPNIAGIDPMTRKLTRLFHPRRHKWERHFCWNGAYVVGRTAIGRTTIKVLAMNDPYLVELREELIEEGLFPP